MKLLVVEDEPLTFQRIKSLVKELRPSWEIVYHAETVKSLESGMLSEPNFDLVLCDIHLADGLSFSALKDKCIKQPIIFITAYDQYALSSFDHNCLDYVLKPIDKVRLEKAFEKVERFINIETEPSFTQGIIDQLIQEYTQKQFKRRFLAKSGNKLRFVNIEDIACFYIENGLTYLEETNSNRKSIVDFSLNELENGLLDPKAFYRINRSMIINIEHLIEMKPYLNGRLLLSMCTTNDRQIIVARERVNEFKNWINQ
ncbi:MAG: LytR/AlgR family response regulator transcription factor [Cecembia sp.]